MSNIYVLIKGVIRNHENDVAPVKRIEAVGSSAGFSKDEAEL